MSQNINLIDASLLPRTERLNGRVMLSALALASSAVLAHYGVEQTRLKRALAASAVAAAPADAGPDAAGDIALAQLRLRLARGEALRDALGRAGDLPVNSARLLQDVARALPDSLWLTEIDVQGQRTIRIAGGAVDAASLAVFSTRLGEVAALRGMPIQVLRLEPQPDTEAAAAETAEAGSGVAGARRAVPYLFELASSDSALREPTP